eukprot:TRINITY_DN44657_c0_g1_i1.p3 TRINITY_DN44657_c0_g1~~TRINITY_DN44657_c0_g1_i1.p3  ORF type:complete len:106 (-),score=4.57 TRINITY_DN44657_c0_g1_i1:50-367(-)
MTKLTVKCKQPNYREPNTNSCALVPQKRSRVLQAPKTSPWTQLVCVTHNRVGYRPGMQTQSTNCKLRPLERQLFSPMLAYIKIDDDDGIISDASRPPEVTDNLKA